MQNKEKTRNVMGWYKGQRNKPDPAELILIEITRIFNFRKGNEILKIEKKVLQILWRYDLIKCKKKKIWKWSDYRKVDKDEIKCSEKDQNLPKLFLLKSQNQETKSKEKTKEEMDEIKCLMEKKNYRRESNKSAWDAIKYRKMGKTLLN